MELRKPIRGPEVRVSPESEEEVEEVKECQIGDRKGVPDEVLAGLRRCPRRFFIFEPTLEGAQACGRLRPDFFLKPKEKKMK